jgi:DNA repair protein RadC
VERGAGESEDGPVQALRERLVSSPGVLDDAELLGLLFGGRGRTVRGLGESLLAAAGGLRALACMEASELATAAGLGRERAAQVLAALELARRAHLAPDGRPRLRTAGEVYRYLAPRIALLRHEVFHVLSFNTRNVLLADARVAEGTTDACTVDPREVFRAVLAARATAVIFAHNHPSGDPEPSAEDIALTRRLASAGTLMGIEILDHIVLGAGRFVSLKERGLL